MKKHKFLLSFIAAASFLKALDPRLQIRRETIRINENSMKTPLRIAHLSDLHGCRIPDLLEAVQSFHPDLICCSGDLYDAVQSHSISRSVMLALRNTAPVIACEGNHEMYWKSWKREKQFLQASGICFDPNPVQLVEKAPWLYAAALPDPGRGKDLSLSELQHNLAEDARNVREAFDSVKAADRNAKLLVLSHRASFVKTALESGCFLLLGGHLHGGQWRIFGRGLIAPEEGGRYRFFPPFSGGMYRMKTEQAGLDPVNVCISRGLGDHMIVPRLFNRPELVLIELVNESSSMIK